MRRTSTMFALATLALAGSCAQAQSTAAATSSHATSIHAVGPNGKAVTPAYQDAKGNAIDAQAFIKAMQQGRNFKAHPSPEGNTVVFALQPPGAKGGNSLATSSQPSLDIGEPLPAFQLQTVAGSPVSSSALAGKQTVVDFFFADCEACIEELPALNAYASRHPDMRFLAITLDDATTAKTFVQKRHFAWPVAYDGMPLIKKLGINAFPTMLLLGKDGRVLASHHGSIPVSVTQTVTDAARHAPSEPSASETKKAQLQWLGRWVDTNRSAPSN